MKSLAGRPGGLATRQSTTCPFLLPSLLPPARNTGGTRDARTRMKAACRRGPGGYPEGARVLQRWGLPPLARRPPCPVLVCAARRAAEPHPDSRAASPARSRPLSRRLQPAPSHAPPPGHPFPPLRSAADTAHGAPCTSLGERPVEKTEKKVKEVTKQGLYLFNKKIGSLKK